MCDNDYIPELIVATRIYEVSVVKNSDVWYARLVYLFDGMFSKSELSKIIDKLFDMGVIKGKWLHINNGKWVYSLYITNDYLSFIKEVYEHA